MKLLFIEMHVKIFNNTSGMIWPAINLYISKLLYKYNRAGTPNIQGGKIILSKNNTNTCKYKQLSKTLSKLTVRPRRSSPSLPI